jgi:integrase
MAPEDRMPLTDAQIRALKATERPYRKSDNRGLYIEVFPIGSKLWRYKYRFGGKEKRLALGCYPQVKLGEARRRRDAARLQLNGGVDPSLERKRAKAGRRIGASNTFSSIAEEFIRKREKEGLAPATASKARWFVSLLEPTIGSLALGDIGPTLLLLPLKRLEARGLHETAKKTLNIASRVFRHGVVTGRAKADPAALLVGALITHKPNHYAAVLNQARLGDLLRAIDDYDSPITRLALKILAHVFLRPGELRFAKWDEIDFEKGVWTIPADRTKMRRAHFVPLSRTVIELLREAHRLGEPHGYVFPALNKRNSPMSENTLNIALRRMGFKKNEATSHGFRATASTFLNELSPFSADAIERALAHAPKSAVRAVYHRGEHWDERVQMAQWWSEFLTNVERGERAAKAA